MVQALKYEDFNEVCAGMDPRSLSLSVRSFGTSDSFTSVATALHSSESGGDGERQPAFETDATSGQETTPLLLGASSSGIDRVVRPEDLGLLLPESSDFSVDLPTFLIQRACVNSALSNYLYWLVTFLALMNF